MKLREAADILNLPLEDITVESLKLSYRKLVLAWDPEKCKDLSARQKYMLITEAYKKLSGVIEGKESFPSDEQHELAAFMRMFMDMVGISGNESISNAAMTFGMMFGSRSSSVDEWSSDENDFEDDEAEAYDEIIDEEYDYSKVSKSISGWEPQVKVYSNMNLKEEISNTKSSNVRQAIVNELENSWVEKKQEKKRKSKKEGKQTEIFGNSPTLPSENLSPGDTAVDEFLLKQEFLDCIQYGNFEKSFQLLSLVATDDDSRSQTYSLFYKELGQSNLLHKCISENKLENNSSLIMGRIKIAEYLLNSKNVQIDLSCCDESCLSVLHKSVVYGDNEFLKFIIRIITDAETANHRINLNLNSRCRKKGWAPVHYAVEKRNNDAILYLANAGANLQVTSATDKKLTPMELAKQKLKSAVDETSKIQFVVILNTLTELSSSRKSVKKRNKTKTDLDADLNSNKATVDSSAIKETKANTKEKKRKRSEKKKMHESIHNIKADDNMNTAKEVMLDTNIYTDLEISVSSRDEMVDHLLAMGFKESECLTAISLYGTDIDKILSWLCEKPSSQEMSSQCEAIAVPEVGGKAHFENEQVQLNRKREEMRRINRAWNARAEDEKRKAGAVKKISEDVVNCISQSPRDSIFSKESADVTSVVVQSLAVAPMVTWSSSSMKHPGDNENFEPEIPLMNHNLVESIENSANVYYAENLNMVGTKNIGVGPTLNVTLGYDYYPPITDLFSSSCNNTTDNFHKAPESQMTFASHEKLGLRDSSNSDFLDLQLHSQRENDNNPFIAGTPELSAGAKPFIPKNFVVSNQNNPILPMDLDTLPVLHQQYPIETSQFFQQYVWNTDAPVTNYSLGGIIPQDFQSQRSFVKDEREGIFFDSLLSSSLLDSEFEYDSASNLMPVLESLFDGSELK